MGENWSCLGGWKKYLIGPQFGHFRRFGGYRTHHISETSAERGYRNWGYLKVLTQIINIWSVDNLFPMCILLCWVNSEHHIFGLPYRSDKVPIRYLIGGLSEFTLSEVSSDKVRGYRSMKWPTFRAYLSGIWTVHDRDWPVLRTRYVLNVGNCIPDFSSFRVFKMDHNNI